MTRTREPVAAVAGLSRGGPDRKILVAGPGV